MTFVCWQKTSNETLRDHIFQLLSFLECLRRKLECNLIAIHCKKLKIKWGKFQIINLPMAAHLEIILIKLNHKFPKILGYFLLFSKILCSHLRDQVNYKCSFLLILFWKYQAECRRECAFILSTILRHSILYGMY